MSGKKLNKRIIITGASGFIGYALVKKYLDLNYEVYAVTKKNKTNLHLLQNVNLTILCCDLKNILDLDNMIFIRGFDAFIHLAWQGVSNEEANDVDIQLANAKYAGDAVKAAKSLECQKFLFAASIMEYEMIKLMETEIPANTRNVYRTAKITAHYLTRIIANELNMEYNAMVFSNVYGNGEISNRFINSTLRMMLKGEKTKFSAATQLYDFIYIDDAINIIIKVAESGINNRNYYIGSMEPRVLKEYILEMRNCVDKNLELGFGESKEYVGVSLNYNELDIKAVYKDFNFVPQYSFKQGIKYTINWLKSLEGGKVYEDN